MAADPYSALWLSHTTIRTFLTCPKAYYYGTVYRDPVTNHKIKIISPPLALGQAVHEVLDSISTLPTPTRFLESLVIKLDTAWEKVAGEKGGFFDTSSEYQYKTRAQDMLRRVMHNPGPLAHPAVKIKTDLPKFWLSDEDNIILCGKVDWLEYLPETDSVHIIDFKTGANNEEEGSLQLPIYHLLVLRTQNRTVTKASYWYLEQSDTLEEKELPDAEESAQKLLEIGKRIKLHRQLQKFECPSGEDGCYSCKPFARIVAGEGKLVGVDEYNNDVYILPPKEKSTTLEDESYIV